MAITADTRLDNSPLTRALYSSDASLYRVTPQAVARPRNIDEIAELAALARAAEMPLTMRGAGTSIAGNAVGPGLVVDTRQHLNTISAIDPQARTATVEPGVVPARLQSAVRRFGLRFGPDPSTVNRCTIGGMIGNNACGPRALGYGRTADNVIALDVITGTGERLHLDRRDRAAASDSPTLAALRELVMANLGTIRTEFGTFTRQVSGYSLEHLLPERGFDVARFLVGSEGTLAIVTGATVGLVPDPAHTLLIALGYASMADAADQVPAVLRFGPTAVEGMDRRIVSVAAGRGRQVPDLPRGDGWLFVELAGDDRGVLAERGRNLIAEAATVDARLVTELDAAAALWQLRTDGAGLAETSLERPAYPGWEDAAVPPARLGAYLRGFEELLAVHGLHALPYGHFGEGCVHARIDFPLDAADGRARLRAFLTDAAALTGSCGGSMSGEHGDGRARSELLPRMYSPAALALFAAVKHIFDPANLLNPKVIVDPAPLDAQVRRIDVVGSPLARAHPALTTEVHRCSGVGKCISLTPDPADVMCPSYRATGREQDSTRGRARVLQEMLAGKLVTRGFSSGEVATALDLCLACKGCARDCPAGVDLASYKSQVLELAWAGRVRPRGHYTLGALPRWARLVAGTPGLARLVNAALALPGLARGARWLAGIDQRRPLPRFTSRPARRTLPARAAVHPNPTARPVALWIDSFSDTLEGSHLVALLALLTSAGYAPQVIGEPVCCGLTWITTGQRATAAKHLRRALDVLGPIAAAGVPILGVEPSCLAVWRSDAAELVNDPRVTDVAAATRTLAELLNQTPKYRPPDLSGRTIVAQPHCHHAAVLGWPADAALLARTGAQVTTLGGCCGLAGSFGVEPGHYEVSVAVAEDQLLPALRAAAPDAILLADGFSCRKQISDLTGRQALTLAELLTPGGC